MNTYFVRHTQDLGVTDAAIRQLQERGQIALHWEDIPSFDPKDYSSPAAKGAFKALADLAENGGYVCARYFGVHGCLVADVKPGTRGEILKEDSRDHPLEKLTLKTLQLSSIQRLPTVRASAILVGRPRQGTIARFTQAGDLIQVLVRKQKVQPDLERLLPCQQEGMCSEYLRMSDTGFPCMNMALMRVGGTHEDVDVIGMTEAGQKIYAQVTFLSEQQCKTKDKTGKSKYDNLAKYSENRRNRVILFCECEKEYVSEPEGVQIIPIGKVYEHFRKHPEGRLWLREAFRGTFGENMDMSSLN